MIIPMVRIRVMGPRHRLAEALAVIQDEGVLHLAPPPEDSHLRFNALTPAETRRRRQLTRILDDVEAVVESASTPAIPGSGVASPDCVGWARQARRVRRALARLDRRAAELQEEQALLQRYQGFFAVFESLLQTRPLQAGFSAFHVVLRADQGEMLAAIRQALGEKLGGACETLDRPLPGGETAVLLL